jgi:hypothetical protein
MGKLMLLNERANLCLVENNLKEAHLHMGSQLFKEDLVGIDFAYKPMVEKLIQLICQVLLPELRL